MTFDCQQKQRIEQQEPTIFFLEDINSFPLPLHKEFYRAYPGMKLGHPADIVFFSQHLAVLANSLIRSSSAQQDWVITAPPYFHLPAAANFLARNVQSLLRQQYMDIPLHELRLNPASTVECTTEEFNNSYNYSKNNVQQRIAERERVQQMLICDGLSTAFSGKHVITINDINVTGTQQQFIQKTLFESGAISCYWIYIFNIEKKLAHTYPEIEHYINTSQLSDLDSYARILGHPDTLHTARCISRLFNESRTNFYALLGKLPAPAIRTIRLLAQQEGKYNSPVFKEKMDLLANYENLCIS